MSKLRLFLPGPERESSGVSFPLATYLEGKNTGVGTGTTRDNFRRTMSFEQSCRRVGDVKDANVILCTVPLLGSHNQSELIDSDRTILDNTRSVALKSRKPVLCHGRTADVSTESEIGSPFSNAIYLNPCLVDRKLPPYAMACPFFIPDCRLEFPPDSLYLNKTDKPSVDFAGVAAPLKTPWSKTRVFDYGRLFFSNLDRLGIDPEIWASRVFRTNLKHVYRVRLLDCFRKSSRIDLTETLRESGGLVNHAYTNAPDGSDYFRDFYKGISENLYSICCRGTENYSVRFYETLCMGRIPVIVNTNVVLPFEKQFNYRENCVWIEKHQVPNADDVLLRFHCSHSESSLIQIQQQNREFWENWLSHDKFYSRLKEVLSL